jgi:hypothetical protein
VRAWKLPSHVRDCIDDGTSQLGDRFLCLLQKWDVNRRVPHHFLPVYKEGKRASIGIRLLEPFDRLKRLDLLRKEAIIEHIARTALRRIVLNENLWPHFANRKGLEAFWTLAPDVRRAIWGDPVNPLDALTEFDPKYIQDGDLGA